ncbi:MAG: helix-turn-helix transcriptional regulator [Bacteroides sp.]|nr:helix-turn-helix transcriptional regulator [Bacteroides sp.]
MKKCGEVIDQILTKRRIRRNELCAYLNISPQYMTKLLKKDSLDAEMLERICQYLEIDPADFFDYRPNDNNKPMSISSVDQKVWASDTHVNMHGTSSISSIELLNLLIKEKDARIAGLEEINCLLRDIISKSNQDE